MITLEIAFNSYGLADGFHSHVIGMEFCKEMKSDRSPSLWEDVIFSKLSGTMVHIFDRAFLGKPGYRAIFDDIDDNVDFIKFHKLFMDEFDRLIEFCISKSNDGSIFVCSDCQFGPDASTYETNSREFLKTVRAQGIRVNSCAHIKNASV